jgi:hypothetical protein
MKKYTFLTLAVVFLLSLSPIFLHAQCSSGQHLVKVSLEINGAWTQLGWDMYDMTGTHIMSRPNMPSNSSNSWVYDSACVATGTVLKYRIFDGKGFGLCCEYGDGVHIVEVDGQEVLRGGPFFRPEENFVFQVNKPQIDANYREIYLNDTLASYIHWVRGRVHNTGTNPITDLTVNWTIGGEGVRTHTFSGLNILPGEEYRWTHPYGWDANQMGDFEFKSWISDVNGSPDLLAANDSIHQMIHIYQPKRNVLAEYITNFYCGPCARWMVNIKERVNLNQSFAFALGLHSDGWGGNDIFYQASPVDMQGRIDFYNTNSHPNARLMGISPGSYPAKHITQSRLQQESRIASPFEISVPVVSMTGNQLDYSADITAPNGRNEANLAVHVAIVERHIELSPQPNGETYGDWVLRKMLPDFNGTAAPATWTNGQVLPVQGSFTVTNAIDTDNLGVLVFIQNTATRVIYNVNYAPLKGPDTSIPSTSIDEQGPLQHIKIYPNPASDVVFVEAEFAQASEVELQLSNAHGQVVKKLSHQAFIGRQAYRLELNDLAGGLYFLSVVADERISYSGKVWVK